MAVSGEGLRWWGLVGYIRDVGFWRGEITFLVDDGEILGRRRRGILLGDGGAAFVRQGGPADLGRGCLLGR